MKYTLGLVDALGNIVARSDIDLHAHGEGTRTLTADEKGIGKKGDVVRVPSALEDPQSDADLRGLQLIIVCDKQDDDSTITYTAPIAGAGQSAALLTSRVDALAVTVAELRAQLDAQKTTA